MSGPSGVLGVRRPTGARPNERTPRSLGRGRARPQVARWSLTALPADSSRRARHGARCRCRILRADALDSNTRCDGRWRTNSGRTALVWWRRVRALRATWRRGAAWRAQIRILRADPQLARGCTSLGDDAAAREFGRCARLRPRRGGSAVGRKFGRCAQIGVAARGMARADPHPAGRSATRARMYSASGDHAAAARRRRWLTSPGTPRRRSARCDARTRPSCPASR